MAKGDKQTVKVINDHGPMGFFMFLAWIGAFVYFLESANGFWQVVGAFFEAIVWPAILLYQVLKLLGA